MKGSFRIWRDYPFPDESVLKATIIHEDEDAIVIMAPNSPYDKLLLSKEREPYVSIKHYPDKDYVLSHYQWERFYFEECRQAALTFLMFGKRFFVKDIVQIIAKLVYFSEAETCWSHTLT